MSSIVVVGAGVVGLTTALCLKRAFPTAKVSIVAQFLPGDSDITYTSPYAGANWHTFSDDDDLVLQEFDKPGYSKFLELANEPRSGVWTKKSYAYLNKSSFDDLGRDRAKFFKWYRHFVRDFKEVDPRDFPASDIALGFSFTGVVITVPIYLNYLLSECLACGIEVRRKRLASIAEARRLHPGGADLVVNCTGLMATRLGGVVDPNRNYPVRGQVLHVSNNAPYKVSVSFDPQYPDELLYVMPRKEGGCIIGGCTYADANSNVDDRLTQRIITRAVKYVPELVDPSYADNPSSIEVIKVNVGLRPAREGGARVEQDPSHDWLIHNYGAGGGGYQGSYGFAERVLQIVRQRHRSKI